MALHLCETTLYMWDVGYGLRYSCPSGDINAQVQLKVPVQEKAQVWTQLWVEAWTIPSLATALIIPQHH